MIAPKRVPRVKGFESMTVCIAAACEGGRKCVTATDSLLSYAGITADLQADKRRWKGEWQFMYAGNPANATMIFGELDEIILRFPEAKERRYIEQSISAAFQSFLSKASSFGTLAPYDMTMKDFKKDGLRVFGEQIFHSMADDIERAASNIVDQMLVVGWGHAPAAVMVSEINRYGLQSHGQSGLAAIGSGGEVALSNMLLLGQCRNSTLAETIYNVAAAKFSAEHSEGLSVGRRTNIHISWKRPEGDTSSIVGCFVDGDDIQALRETWETHGRPRMPDAARPIANGIAQKLTGGISVTDMVAHINVIHRINEQARNRTKRAKRSASRKSEDRQ